MAFGKKCYGLLKAGLKSGFGSEIVGEYPAFVLDKIEVIKPVEKGSFDDSYDVSSDDTVDTYKTNELLLEVAGGDSDWAVAVVSPEKGNEMPGGSYVSVIKKKTKFFWVPGESYQLEPEDIEAFNAGNFAWTDAPGEFYYDDPSVKFFPSFLLFVSK